MRKFFRDIPTSILMIIGLSLSYFVVFNSINLYVGISNEKALLNQYCYSSTVDINMKDDNGFDESFFDYINAQSSSETIKITLHKVHVFVNNEVANYNAEIVFDETNDKVVIGETIAKHFGLQSNSKINILGVDCEVTSIGENITSAGIDKSIVINWNTCPEELKQILIKDIFNIYGCTILIESNEPIDNVINGIVRHSEIYELSTFVDEVELTTSSENKWSNSIEKVFLLISLMFSIVVVVSTTRLWIERRSEEIAVRIAYGFSRKKISILFIDNVFKLSLAAMLVSICLNSIYFKIFSVNNHLINNLGTTIALFVFYLIFIIFIVAREIYVKFKNYSLIEELGRSRCE